MTYRELISSLTLMGAKPAMRLNSSYGYTLIIGNIEFNIHLNLYKKLANVSAYNTITSRQEYNHMNYSDVIPYVNNAKLL